MAVRGWLEFERGKAPAIFALGLVLLACFAPIVGVARTQTDGSSAAAAEGPTGTSTANPTEVRTPSLRAKASAAKEPSNDDGPRTRKASAAKEASTGDGTPRAPLGNAEGVPFGPPPPPDAGQNAVTDAAPSVDPSSAPAATVVAPPANNAATGSTTPDAMASAAGAAATARNANYEVAEVRVRDMIVLRLKLEDGGLVPAVRAKRAERAIEAALADANPESVRTESKQDRVLLFVGSRPIVELTRADAEAIGEGSLELFAASAAAKVRDVLENERQRSKVTRSAFSVALVVFLAVIVLYALRLLGLLARRLREFVNRNPERIPAIRLRSIEVVGPHVLRSGIVVGLGVLKLLMQVGLIFTWLLFSSSLFDATRGMTGQLTALVLTPLSGLATRFVALLPLVLLTTMAAVALVVLLRFVALFFAGVERRETELAWLRPELAAPTSLLIRIGLVVVSLLVLAPLVTGNVDGSLARVGMVSVVAIALATTPLAANVVVGLVTLYGHRLELGDEVRIGPHRGTLLTVDLVELRLRAVDGREFRVPHFVTLVRPFSVVGKSSVVSRCLVVTAEAKFDQLTEIFGTHQVFTHRAKIRLVKIEGSLTTLQLTPSQCDSAVEERMLIEVARELEAKQIRLVLAEWRPSA